MKHLKTKLMASVAMLMVATVMISSASFAWFTLSTAPEVRGITTNVATNGSLEIALASDTSTTAGTITYNLPSNAEEQDDGTFEGGTGKNTAWGNLVDISNYFTQVEDDSTLKPVKMTDAGLKYPEFGNDGRIKQLTALTAYSTPIQDTDTTAETYIDGTIVTLKDAEDGNNWAYRVDYFLRTNTDGDISLLIPGDDVDLDRGNGTAGAGCTLGDGADDDSAFLADIVAGIEVFEATDTEDGTYVAAETKKLEFTKILEDGEFEDEALFNAEANKIYLVSMYVYWDGESATNESMAAAANDTTQVQLNIQFQHEEDLTPVIAGEADDEEEEGGEEPG